MNFEEKKQYIGHISQLFSVKEYKLCGGKAEGVKAADISNGGNLDITVLPDRCMDFFQIRFKGKNLNYITPAGIVAPQYYDSYEFNWLSSFAAGFLTTCGLDNIGVPKEGFGLHGKISNTPAENVYIGCEIVAGVPQAILKGTMRQARLFGENLTLTREIRCNYGEDIIYFTDTVTNHSFKEVPYKLLYHFNMGYPLLDENSIINIPSKSFTARDENAQKHINEWNKVTSPADGFQEMCYFHNIVPNENGRAEVGIFNPAENIGVKIDFDAVLLDNFVQWKMLGKCEYVTGLEPANCELDIMPEGSKDTKKYLKPQESVELKFKLTFY